METSQWWQIYWLNGHHKKNFMKHRLALTTLWELIVRGDVHSRSPVLFNPLQSNLYIYITPFTEFPRALYRNVITTVLKHIQVYWWPTFRLENAPKGTRLLNISWQQVRQWQTRKKIHFQLNLRTKENFLVLEGQFTIWQFIIAPSGWEIYIGAIKYENWYESYLDLVWSAQHSWSNSVQEEKNFQQLVGLQCMKDYSEDCIISMWKINKLKYCRKRSNQTYVSMAFQRSLVVIIASIKEGKLDLWIT